MTWSERSKHGGGRVPEGDTLRRAAEELTPILEDRVVTALRFRKLRGHRPRVGDRIHSVDAVGKYLLIEFDRRLVLHTHLGMAGSWRASPLDRAVPHTPKCVDFPQNPKTPTDGYVSNKVIGFDNNERSVVYPGKLEHAW